MILEQSHTETVYVVDDDQSMRDSIQWTLHSVGYRVELFSDAQECLDSLGSESPNCVLVDLLLPGMSGMKLCEKLESRLDCSFVMISGHGEVKSAVQAMKLGAVDFLEKPFDRESLLDAVFRAVEHTKSLQEQIAEEKAIATKLYSLSSQEREIFDGLADGLTTEQIADSLGFPLETVDKHRSNISEKLNLDSPRQLANAIYLLHRSNARSS